MFTKLVNVCLAGLLVTGVSLPGTSAALDGTPKYASSRTEKIINRMIEAHGGMARWKNAPSISYDFVMHLPIMEQMSQGKMKGWDLWVAAHTSMQPKSQQGHTELPWEGASIASDGNEIWSIDYPGGNSPVWRLWHHYSYITMPWLTQDSRVMLGEVSKGKLPNDPREYHVIKMTVDRANTEGKDLYFKMYIDPDTYLLKANVYNTPFPAIPEALLPENPRQMPGDMLRISEHYVTVDGLTIPSRYSTTDPKGESLFGMHLILNPSISKKFDNSRMEKPANAVVGNMMN